jgi:hypothetical protein
MLNGISLFLLRIGRVRLAILASAAMGIIISQELTLIYIN